MLDLLDEEIGSDRNDLPKSRSGLNYQTNSSGTSGTSHRPIFQYLKGLDWLDEKPGRNKVGPWCIVTLKWFMSQFWRNILLQFAFPPFYRQMRRSCRLALKRNQSNAISNLTMLMTLIICLFQRAEGLSRKSGLMDGGWINLREIFLVRPSWTWCLWRKMREISMDRRLALICIENWVLMLVVGFVSRYN